MTHSFRYDWWPVILIRFTDSFWIHYGDISLSYRDETTQISYGLFFRLMMGKAHIDMTQGCRIDMIGCSLSYRDDSYWNDVRSRIDMSLTLVLIWPPLSYRYVEGKEDFVPSVISQSESHISYHFDWKDWRSLTSFLGLSHRWNDRSFWARKGAIDETANLRPKTLTLLSFQSDRRFLKKLLLKSS